MAPIKDYITPILFGLSLVLFIVAAATPFAKMGDISYYYFQICASSSTASLCQKLTPSSEFFCSNAKNMYLGAQATGVITILLVVCCLLISLARGFGKCLSISGIITAVLIVITCIFGLVFTAVAFALFFTDMCDIGTTIAKNGSIGPSPPLALVAEIVALGAAIFCRHYWNAVSGTSGTYQAY